MYTEAYDRTAYTLTIALQTATPEATWRTATINDLMQGGDPSLAEDSFIVEVRVPAREFLLLTGFRGVLSSRICARQSIYSSSS